MSTIAALVIGLEERNLIGEALDSVEAQTRQPDEMHWRLDGNPRLGEAGNMNELIRRTERDWIAFLHDDDLWHPEHLEAAEPYMEDYDVIVSNFRLIGRPQDTIEPYHEDFNDLRFTNWFPPSCVIARRSVFGHWSPERAPMEDPWFSPSDTSLLHSNAPWLDWANWRRLLHDGARFVRTRRSTVDYRFFGDNGSWTAEQAASAGSGTELDILSKLAGFING